MSSVSYLPHVAPKNNNTSQMRRRVNDVVSAVTVQQGEITTLQNPAPPSAPTPSPAFTNAPLHTTANAGGASALPATPAGYTTIQINGQTFKVALYTV